MKAKVNYNDKEVEIELTEEQIEKINNTKFGDYRDIQTFENACEATGEKWTEPKSLPVDVIAYMKLRIIAKALNGGSWMTYEDTDEGKYYPWFNATGSASGFSFIASTSALARFVCRVPPHFKVGRNSQICRFSILRNL